MSELSLLVTYEKLHGTVSVVACWPDASQRHAVNSAVAALSSIYPPAPLAPDIFQRTLSYDGQRLNSVDYSDQQGSEKPTF